VAQSNYRENTALPVKKKYSSDAAFSNITLGFFVVVSAGNVQWLYCVVFLHSLKISLHVVLFAGILSMFCVHAGAKKGIFVFH